MQKKNPNNACYRKYQLPKYNNNPKPHGGGFKIINSNCVGQVYERPTMGGVVNLRE